MSYIDGFVIAVPRGNKQKFIDHAKQGDSVFHRERREARPRVLGR